VDVHVFDVDTVKVNTDIRTGRHNDLQTLLQHTLY